jgi:hypothetical protein
MKQFVSASTRLLFSPNTKHVNTLVRQQSFGPQESDSLHVNVMCDITNSLSAHVIQSSTKVLFSSALIQDILELFAINRRPVVPGQSIAASTASPMQLLSTDPLLYHSKGSSNNPHRRHALPSFIAMSGLFAPICRSDTPLLDHNAPSPSHLAVPPLLSSPPPPNNCHRQRFLPSPDFRPSQCSKASTTPLPLAIWAYSAARCQTKGRLLLDLRFAVTAATFKLTFDPVFDPVDGSLILHATSPHPSLNNIIIDHNSAIPVITNQTTPSPSDSYLVLTIFTQTVF